MENVLEMYIVKVLVVQFLSVLYFWKMILMQKLVPVDGQSELFLMVVTILT